MKKITSEQIAEFKEHLILEEKSKATVDKYGRDIEAFAKWASKNELNKAIVLSYKAYLCEKYAVSSVNSILSSMNSFFNYFEWFGLRVKTIKTQRQIFAQNEKEISKAEYERLLICARSTQNERLYLLLQTICSTGIRVSELRFITVEAVSLFKAEINCKGKQRYVFLPIKLCKILQKYAAERKIKSGPIFISKNGNPLDRSNIWCEMKKICRQANVAESKVFPHNLRHLFARTYYTMQKDIVRLADILGHSSVNTTRIYTMENGAIHQKQIENLGLVDGVQRN